MNLLIAPLLTAMAFTAGAVTVPNEGGEAVMIRIGAVLASNSGQEFDPRLVSMSRQFRMLFPYTSYRLVKEQRQRVLAGGKAGFDIPGGRYLLVIPKGFQNGRVSMRVMLIEGTRPVVDTALTLRNHATFLVGGPRHLEGVLIIVIGADSAPDPVDAASAAVEGVPPAVR